MKILVVTTDDFPHSGGKSSHIQQMISGLETLGVECEVFARNNAANLSMILKLMIQPTRLLGMRRYLYWRKRAEWRAYSVKLQKRLHHCDFDIISAQDAAGGTIAGRLMPGVLILLTMHTYFGLEYTLDNPYIPLESREYGELLAFESEALRHAKAVIAVDRRIKRHIEESIMAEPGNSGRPEVREMMNFTDTELFSPKTDTIHPASDRPFTLVCARRLVEKNGIIHAVEAVNRLRGDMDIRLIIAGEGPERTRLETYIRENRLEGLITFAGAVPNDEMPGLYAGCDAALIPSITVNGLQEATSISAIESMACGLPTIASDIGGLSELIIDHYNGILVPEKDARAIAEAVRELYADQRLSREIGMRARKTILQSHSHKASAGIYLDLFRSVIRTETGHTGVINKP